MLDIGFSMAYGYGASELELFIDEYTNFMVGGKNIGMRRRMHSMTEQDTLKKLIDDGRVSATLRQGSLARNAITSLQTLLHWLGFDRKLRWKRFGADGDYGKATAAAVAEFAKRNGSTANGSQVSSALAEKILARYDTLEELKQLAEDVEKKRIERHYKRGGTDRLRIATLQTLLHDLGFDAELNWRRFGADGDYGRSTAAAVAALSKQEGIAGNGRMLTTKLARWIVAELSQFYGDSWRGPSHTPTPVPGSLSVTSVIGSNSRQFLEVSDVTTLPAVERDRSKRELPRGVFFRFFRVSHR